MRITSKGQVTIPADIREAAGLLPNTEVNFEIHDGTVRIVRSDAPKKPSRGALLVAHLRAHKGDVRMTTDEMWQLAGYVKTVGSYDGRTAATSRNDAMQARPAENRAPARDAQVRDASRR